jgi:hypothetical protein
MVDDESEPLGQRPRSAAPDITRTLQNLRLEIAQMRVLFTQLGESTTRIVDLLDQANERIGSLARELHR